MKMNELDDKLQRLHEAGEQIAGNLVELEIDSSRQLLEASRLEGESAARWSAASATLTELWQWHGLLQAVLERAAKVRGGRRFDQLLALLEGPSIELSKSEVPLANRDLLGSPEVSVRCSPDELLVRMSSAFDQVKTVLAGIGGAWETLIPGLDAARPLLAESTRLAEELGESERRDLESASHMLAALSASITTDPLSVAAGDLDGLIQSLQAIRADLESTAALRRELDVRLADARGLLERLRRAVRAGQAAHEAVVVKISVPAAPQAPQLRDDLEAKLWEIAALAQRRAWLQARRMLDEWTLSTNELLAEAERLLGANRAPIEARNQFRALLEAYQVKAQRLGMVEDPALADIFAQAHEALYNAPSDLALVAQLVRRYEEALSSAQPTPEAIL
jgi:hypothetical protein